jgi:hypothetical protein
VGASSDGRRDETAETGKKGREAGGRAQRKARPLIPLRNEWRFYNAALASFFISSFLTRLSFAVTNMRV